MQLFSKLEGIPSQSEVDGSVLGKLYIFMVRTETDNVTVSCVYAPYILAKEGVNSGQPAAFATSYMVG